MKQILISVFLLIVLNMSIAQNKPFKSITIPSQTTVQLTSAAPSAIDGRRNRLADSSDVPIRYSEIQIKGMSAFTDSSILEVKKERGRPIMVEKRRAKGAERMRMSNNDLDNIKTSVRQFISSSPDLFGQFDTDGIRIRSILNDRPAEVSARGVQTFKGFEVYGTDFTFNVNSRSERFLGRTVNENQISTSVRLIDVQRAIQNSLNDLEQRTRVQPLSDQQKQMIEYYSPKVDTIYYPDVNKCYHLTFQLAIRPNFMEEWIYFIKAADGTVLHRYNNTQTQLTPTTFTGKDLNDVPRPINIVQNDDRYELRNVSEEMFNPIDSSGQIIITDALYQSVQNYHPILSVKNSNSWSGNEVSALWGLTESYRRFKTIFGRNSIDNQGMTIRGIINVNEPSGRGLDNAYWNNPYMVFGNGDVAFKPLAGALDVIGHEMGHGVISHTARLEYQYQSGAINETYADIFGSTIKGSSWKIGEDIVELDVFPAGAMRDMSNPHNGAMSNTISYQPAHLSEMYTGTDDNGGVHINSGIGNFAYYKYAISTSREKAEKVFYHALTQTLTKTSQFVDFRIAVVQAARDLYGDEDARLVGKAFDEVGILDDSPIAVEDGDLLPNPGLEHILVSLFNDQTQNYGIYRFDPETNQLSSFSEIEALSRPSVSDNIMGQTQLTTYVGIDHRMYLYSNTQLATPPLDGQIASAISKDGRLLAVVSDKKDGMVTITNVFTGRSQEFKLYNPTTGDGDLQSNEVQFAHSLDFDHLGQNLIYDACNKMGDREYWDIGIIHVWDRANDTFGSGLVQKPFGSLPEGLHVGNPVFSKNSPHLLAFDYMDREGKYATFIVNLSTGKMNILFENNTLSNPTFGTHDNYIAFEKKNESGDLIVQRINLSTDKMSVVGEPITMFEGKKAHFPIYYGTGFRDLGLKPTAAFTAAIHEGITPFDVHFFDQSINDATSWLWSFEGGTPSTSTERNPIVSYHTEGNYKVTLTATNEFGESTLEKDAFIKATSSTTIEKTKQTSLLVYPSPASDYLMIQNVNGRTIQVVDILGTNYPLNGIEQSNQSMRIDIRSLPNGIYLLIVGEQTTKLVVRK